MKRRRSLPGTSGAWPRVAALLVALVAMGCKPAAPPPAPPTAATEEAPPPAVDSSDAWFAYFAPGRYQITAPDSFFSIGYAVAVLDRGTTLQVLVVGHADGGRGDVARQLALLRARAVRDVLLHHGVAANRILIAIPKEKAEPTDPSLSRRAEIYVYDPAVEEVSHRLGYEVEIRQD